MRDVCTWNLALPNHNGVCTHILYSTNHKQSHTHTSTIATHTQHTTANLRPPSSHQPLTIAEVQPRSGLFSASQPTLRPGDAVHQDDAPTGTSNPLASLTFQPVCVRDAELHDSLRRTKGGRGADADGHPISVVRGRANGKGEMESSTAQAPGEMNFRRFRKSYPSENLENL